MTENSYDDRGSRPVWGTADVLWEEIERGRTVFQVHCHQCHPGGEGGLGPGLNDKPAPAWLVKTQVRLGLGVMPGFQEQQISSKELDDLMAYIVALRKDS